MTSPVVKDQAVALGRAPSRRRSRRSQSKKDKEAVLAGEYKWFHYHRP
jgi:hypothetical protein